MLAEVLSATLDAALDLALYTGTGAGGGSSRGAGRGGRVDNVVERVEWGSTMSAARSPAEECEGVAVSLWEWVWVVEVAGSLWETVCLILLTMEDMVN